MDAWQERALRIVARLDCRVSKAQGLPTTTVTRIAAAAHYEQLARMTEELVMRSRFEPLILGSVLRRLRRQAIRSI